MMILVQHEWQFLCKLWHFHVTNHGEEDAKLRVHVNHVSVGEDELFLLVLLTLQDDVDLLRGD